jgi:hypothetical protein
MIENLPRRKFLRDAGIIGISTFTASHVFAQKNRNLVGDITFLDKISKQTYSLTTLRNNSLLCAYEAVLKGWQDSGYRAFKSEYYVCQGSDVALFPIHLHHESLDSLDFALLCFRKDEDEAWIKSNSLSGFDLEALSAAADILKSRNSEIDVCDYLLPFGNKNLGDGFATRKGSVFTKTLLSQNGSTIEIIVKENDEVLFNQLITTKHTLIV